MTDLALFELTDDQAADGRPECSHCPPGCPSCWAPDCECYTHKDWPDRRFPADPPVELRADDTAAASCRHCQTATTAAGLTTRGHGPGSATCARMRELIRLEEAS